MVFSQTSHKTRSLLKVVEIDRLKPNKNQQVNGLTGGVIADDNTGMMPSSPLPTTSFSEEYLKPEPLFESTMFPEPDYEFFQDLGLSSAQGRDEPAQTTNTPIKKTEERANIFDTANTLFSPPGWDTTSPLAHASFYGTNTPYDSLSPIAVDGFSKFDEFLYPQEEFNKLDSSEILNISDLPVVIGGENEGCGVENLWPVTNNFAWPYTHTPQYSKQSNTTHMPFIPLEDSLNQDDLKYMPVIPQEVENSNVVLTEYSLDHRFKGGTIQEIGVRSHPLGLSVDVAAARGSHGPNISTPDVVNCVVQMEKEETPHFDEKHTREWLPEEVGYNSNDSYVKPTMVSPVATSPPTPAYESQAESDTDDLPRRRATKRRHQSEDSDETYTPTTTTTRKEKERKRKKPDNKIKAIMDALEKTKARRGRPPNRRTSIVSSTGSVEDNASNVSTQEMKYRELRDKNNEASKRSRMNRKLKELQMEQLADELEEQNKKLRVRANILEEMTVKLKNALMAAMTQK